MLSVILVFISIFTVRAQNFVITNYQTNDGLPHNNVRYITTDTTGFLWIATWDGLSRYDGHDFRNYFHDSNDTSSLPFFSVRKLYTDKYNNLWLLTDWNQVVKYNRSRDNFNIVRSIKGIPVENVVTFCEEEEGNIWIITKNSVIYWNENKDECIVSALKDEKGDTFLLSDWEGSFSREGENEYWFAGTSALRFRKGQNGDLILTGRFPVILPPPEKRLDFDFNFQYELVRGNGGSLWLFSNVGLFRFENESEGFREFKGSIPDNEFNGKRYYTWGTFRNGIYSYDALKKTVYHIPYSQTKMPISICRTRDNLLWFSNTTTTGVALGINKTVFTPAFFSNHLMFDSDSAAPAVYAIAADNRGRILAGLRGYDHIVAKDSTGKFFKIDALPSEILNEARHIRSMIPDKNGIWIGFMQKLLQYYEFKTGTFRNYYPEAPGFRAMVLDKSGKLIIGNRNIVKFDPATGRSEVLWDTINQDGIFKMLLDDNGILWCGMSSRNLLRFNTKTGKGKKIQLTTGNCNIEDIISGENGELWLALLGEGVCRYDPAKNTFRYYTTASGLSNNTTYNLLKDKSGNIWVSTNTGISVIQPETGKIRSFGFNEGLKISEFNSGAKFIASDGRFFFGGMGGYAGFYPDSVNSYLSATHSQKIILTLLRSSSNFKYLDKELNTADTIILGSGENNFRLSFSTSDFLSSDKTLYRYRIKELDKEWNKTDSYDRNINYSNLAPRWYHLTIEATDEGGNWDASRQLAIRVEPRFYETWLFIILVPLLIVGVISFSIITYIRQLKQKEQQVYNELKLQSLRGQMNPHFIFNSLNSINYFISKNDRISANRYIADFSRLIRSILANLGNNYIQFENELSSLEDYLRIEHLRFSDKFDYKLQADEDIPKTSFEVCPGLVQPIIENAIWHGVRPLENRKGIINVKFSKKSESKLICIIEDDGIGRLRSEKNKGEQTEHKSKGLNIVTERLQVTSKIRNESFRIEISDLYNDRIETGTRVIVEIPIKIAKR